MAQSKCKCLTGIYICLLVSTSLLCIVLRDTSTLQFYHIRINPFHEISSSSETNLTMNRSQTIETYDSNSPNEMSNQHAANGTNIYVSEINSKLKIKVSPYGRIIDINKIFQPDPIPIFSDRISIVNPSLIKVPHFIENKLGLYYLYFAHHQGPTIYLAISNNSIFGPYTLYKRGAFHMNETKYGGNHIASPDVHINFQKNLIEMYYHISNRYLCQKALKLQLTENIFTNKDMQIASQCTLKAVSKDGLHFTDEYFYLQNNVSLTSYIYGHFYFRVFEFNNKRYAFAKNDNDGGILYGFIKYINKWIILKKYANIPIRHSAIFVDNKRKQVFLFITIDVYQKGHIMLSKEEIQTYEPESIWMAIIDMNNNYELKDMTRILQLNKTLQSPAIYFENNDLYILYCLNAEQNGIDIAKLELLDLMFNDTEYTNDTNNSETQLLIWPRIPKTGGENFMRVLDNSYPSIILNKRARTAYIEHKRSVISNFTIIPYERYDTQYIDPKNILNEIKTKIKEISKHNNTFIPIVIQNHIPFVPSLNHQIALCLQNEINFYRKWKYISFIRDPVSRIVSSFNYIRGTGGGWRSKMAKSSSFRRKYSHLPYNLHYTQYYQPWIENKTNNINECVNMYENGGNECKLSTNYYVKWFCGVECDPFNITNQSLYKAIQNIDKYFEWIGVLEFYDVSFAKFNSQFPKFISANLQNNYLKIKQQLQLERKQMGYGSLAYQKPSARSLIILTKANELDYKLFYYVLEKYNYQ